MSCYYVFYNSGEDERWSISGPLSRAEVESKINGWVEMGVSYLDTFPDVEMSSSSPQVVVNKGAVVLPRPVEVVKKFEVP